MGDLSKLQGVMMWTRMQKKEEENGPNVRADRETVMSNAELVSGGDREVSS
jgi:hypothetical protein